MSDVANTVQVQRGLGSSKLAISSVGGTVNIVSKTTDKQKGGFVRFLGGNDSYVKSTVSYDTGINEKGWAFSVLLDHWQSHRKYSIGTAGQGQNYMFAVGYKPNEKHSFNFLLTGAPQWHDQNFSEDLEFYQAKSTLDLMHLSDQVAESRLLLRNTLTLRENIRRDIYGDTGGVLFRCRNQQPVNCRLQVENIVSRQHDPRQGSDE